jgi:hypothetical protein
VEVQPVIRHDYKYIMRIPIKLNRSYWPRFLCRLLPSADDPRDLLRPKLNSEDFTRAVSTFKFGTVFKSTRKARFPCTIAALTKLTFTRPPDILDVGASDGTTSLEVQAALSFNTYFVTDLNIEVLWEKLSDCKGTYFYDTNSEPILYANRQWIVYNDTMNSMLPLGSFVRRIFHRPAPSGCAASGKLHLINPELLIKVASNIVVRQYDLFSVWPLNKVDVVIAANILNQSYFTDFELKKAIRNLREALKEDGFLVIIDNRSLERASIFSNNGFIVERINGGTEIEALVLLCFTE